MNLVSVSTNNAEYLEVCSKSTDRVTWVSCISLLLFLFFSSSFIDRKNRESVRCASEHPPWKRGCRSQTKKTAFPWKLSDLFFSLYVAMYNDFYIKINASRIINDKTIENDSIRNTLYIIYIEKCRRAICLSHSLSLSPPISLSVSFSLCIQYAAALEIFKSVYWSPATLLEMWRKKAKVLLSCVCNLLFSLPL